MYSPVHATVGFFVARAIPNPILGIAAAVASHYVLDAVPHGDAQLAGWMKSVNPGRRIALVETLDLGTATFMVAFLLTQYPGRPLLYLVAGAVAGVLPDLLWGAHYVLEAAHLRLPLVTRILNWHNRIHAWGHAKLAYEIPFMAGLLYQAAFLAGVFLLRLQ